MAFHPSKRLRTYSHAFAAAYTPDGIVPSINLEEKIITYVHSYPYHTTTRLERRRHAKKRRRLHVRMLKVLYYYYS